MYAQCNNLNKYLNHLSILVTVFITVNLAKIKAESCGQEELSECAKPFEMLQSSDISLANKKEDLDKLCPDLENGLKCIRSYTRRCMSLQQRDHFHKLYNGTHQFVRDLCKEGQYQDEFLRHAPCLQNVRMDYEVCAKRYQNTITTISQQSSHALANSEEELERNYRNQNRRNADDDVRTVCCSFMEYLDCSQRVAEKTCGYETGRFTRGFLDKMSNNLLQMYCESYTKGSNKCPSSSASKLWNSLTNSFIMLITPTLVSILTVSQLRLR